jgi:hypothetical protein
MTSAEQNMERTRERAYGSWEKVSSPDGREEEFWQQVQRDDKLSEQATEVEHIKPEDSNARLLNPKEHRMTIPSSSTSTALYDQALLKELLFLETWENGLVLFWAGTIVRVRQIRKAHPALRKTSQKVKRLASAD